MSVGEKLEMDKKTYETWAHLKGNPDDGFVTIDPKIREKLHALPEERKTKSLAAKTFILFPFEMQEQQRKPFAIKLRETIDFVKNHLLHHRRPYIATSFGSDSIVLMKVVMIAVDELRVEGHDIEYPDMVLNDTLNTFKEEKQYWKDMIDLWNLGDKVIIMKPPKDEKGNMYTVWSIAKKVGHLPQFRQTKFRNKDGTIRTKKDIGGQGSGVPECCDILKKKTLKSFMNSLAEDKRYDCQFVGTRAEESKMRSMSVLQRCRSYIRKTFVKYEIRNVTPLSYWTQGIWKADQGTFQKKKSRMMEGICSCNHAESEHSNNCVKCGCSEFSRVRRKFLGNFKTTEIFVPNDNETEPENDIALFYEKYNIPFNPAYEAHNMKRMGCASCPAHINWEVRLATDPTSEGLGMLKQNLKLLKQYGEAGTDRIERLDESLNILKKLLDGKFKDNKIDNGEIPIKNREKVIDILKEFGKLPDDYYEFK